MRSNKLEMLENKKKDEGGDREEPECVAWQQLGRGSVANARVCSVNQRDDLIAQVSGQVFVDLVELNASVAKDEIRMLLHRLEERELRVPGFERD